MADEQRNIYEGLFLFPQAAAGNLQGALDHLNELFARADAEVVSLCKWDERRLAYEIKGNKRGVYFLAYLRIPPTKMVSLERDCNLSEQLLRAMLTRADVIPQENVEAAEGRDKLADEIKLRTAEEKAEKAEKAAAAAAKEATAETPVTETAPAPEASEEAQQV